MQKELVIQQLKERGCRITKQRRILLDIILQDDCSCCKEIYYKASRLDKRIGPATVYRMVNILEEIGAISRKNMYKISCTKDCRAGETYQIGLDDGTTLQFDREEWNRVLASGLKSCGYIKEQNVIATELKKHECGKEAARAEVR